LKHKNTTDFFFSRRFLYARIESVIVQYKLQSWDLSSLARTHEDVENYLAKAEQCVKELEKLKPAYVHTISEKDFAHIISLVEKYTEVVCVAGQYASLKVSENSKDSEATALNARIDSVSAILGNRMLWVTLDFVKFPKSDIARLISAVPHADYYLRHTVALKDFLLSQNEERVINLKNVNGSNALLTVYDIFATGFTFSWNGVQITQNELLARVRDASPKIRKRAYETLFKVFKEQESVFGEIYRAIVADWRAECIELRHYPSPISVRNTSNDISDEAVKTLLKVAQKNQTVFQEYFVLKAKLLGTKKFRRYDLYAPIVSRKENKKSKNNKSKEKISYQEACEIVLETFKEFSSVFHSLAKSMFDECHIHSLISQGKNQGAFCSSSVPSVKPYVLLNYVGDERSVSTLAHELGHAIHFMLAAKKHSVFHAHACLPLAETASIFSELLLIDKLKELKPKLARSLIFQELDNAYASIGRQIEFVAFEQEAHELIKNHGSTNDLKELYVKRLRAHFGKDCDIPQCFESEWSYVSHIFHTPFYCYAYGFGNLLACSVFAQYKKQGHKIAEKFIALLSAGGSASPQDIVKLIGFDIASEGFWQQGFDVLKELLKGVKKS